jgi:ferric-dicitrate binding protein FerR (iron transport regulator)
MNNPKNHIKQVNDTEPEELMASLGELQVPPSTRSKEDAWNIIMQSIATTEQPKETIRLNNRRVWLAAAAIAALMVISCWSYLWFSRVEVSSPRGVVTDVILPDGSTAKLNADSWLRYPRFYNLVGRRLKIEGEVFFTVTHGSSFVVHDDAKRTVEVVGTEFNMVSRGSTFKVACFSGKVMVSNPGSERVQLVKGEVAVATGKTLKVSKDELHAASAPGWTSGEFKFIGVPLSEVLTELERQFNIKVTALDFNPDGRTFTGYFTKSSLVQALELVTQPMSLRYEFSADSTVVKIYSNE